MNPKRAAIASIFMFALWIAFNVSLIGLGLVQDPWHQPGPYTLGGSAFAIVCGASGLWARTRGKGHLDQRLLSLALIPILGAASFFVCLTMASFGWYD
jgi:hypothetical protein